MLTLITLALAADDAADTAMPGAYVLDTVPLDGAIGIPVDAVPAVLLSGGNGGADTWHVALAANGAELSAFDGATADRFLSFPSPQVLLPAAPHTLTATPTDGAGQMAETSFTTSTEAATVVGLAPAAIEVVPQWMSTGFLTVFVTVTPTADPYGMAALHLTAGSDYDPGYVVVGTADSVSMTGGAALDTRPDTWCVTVAQRDALGAWTPLESCGEVEDAPYDSGAIDLSGTDVEANDWCGCASAPTAPSAALLGVLATFFLRRRR